MLFDADGLAADERVEFAGVSPTGASYRLLRAIEARAVRESRKVIGRSTAAADILAERAEVERERFHVVANGRDEALFAPVDKAEREGVRAELGNAADAVAMVYAGLDRAAISLRPDRRDRRSRASEVAR